MPRQRRRQSPTLYRNWTLSAHSDHAIHQPDTTSAPPDEASRRPRSRSLRRIAPRPACSPAPAGPEAGRARHPNPDRHALLMICFGSSCEVPARRPRRPGRCGRHVMPPRETTRIRVLLIVQGQGVGGDGLSQWRSRDRRRGEREPRRRSPGNEVETAGRKNARSVGRRPR
jgi:hypothetical protein